MKILVVYYSLDGNTRLIADAIARETGADILELRTPDEPKSKGLSKYFWGGRQVVMKIRPRLVASDKSVADYDFLFIGTPVWAFSPTPAVSAFLESANLNGKTVALFCTSDGGMGRALAKMKQILSGNAVAGLMHFVKPRRDQEVSEQKARQWARDVINKL